MQVFKNGEALGSTSQTSAEWQYQNVPFRVCGTLWLTWRCHLFLRNKRSFLQDYLNSSIWSTTLQNFWAKSLQKLASLVLKHKADQIINSQCTGLAHACHACQNRSKKCRLLTLAFLSMASQNPANPLHGQVLLAILHAWDWPILEIHLRYLPRHLTFFLCVRGAQQMSCVSKEKCHVNVDSTTCPHFQSEHT